MTTNNIDIPTLEQIENIIESDEILRNYYYQSVLKKQTHVHPTFTKSFEDFWTGKSRLDYKLFSTKVWEVGQMYIIAELLETTITMSENLYSGRMILTKITDIKATPTNPNWFGITFDETYKFKLPSFQSSGITIDNIVEPQLLPEYVLLGNNMERLTFPNVSIDIEDAITILSAINSKVSNYIPYNEKRHESITAEIKWFVHQYIQSKIKQTNGQNN